MSLAAPRAPIMSGPAAGALAGVGQVIPFPAPEPLAGTPDPADAAAAIAASLRSASLLARGMSEALLASVQGTTRLNLAVSRALLQHARIKPPPALRQRSEHWQLAWRSYEICMTSADAFLGLARGQVDRNTDALWRSAQRLIGELEQQGAAGVAELHTAFATLERAQAGYWQAAQEAHGAILAWVQAAAGAEPPQAARRAADASSNKDRPHVAH